MLKSTGPYLRLRDDANDEAKIQDEKSHKFERKMDMKKKHAMSASNHTVLICTPKPRMDTKKNHTMSASIKAVLIWKLNNLLAV